MSQDRPTPEHRRRQKQVKFTASGIAFLIGFVVLVILMLPNPWGIAAGVVVGGAAGASTYGMMYGRELNLQRRSELTTAQTSMRGHLSELETTVRTRSEQFPPSSRSHLRMIVVGLEEIVERWETLSRAPEQQDAVYHTITRHLPRTLELFLELPDSAKPDHAEEFKHQISLMTEAVAKTRDHVVAKDLQALRTHRLLLEEALTDPDERLFRENGL